ncbi:MAG: hypothetical protein C0518_04725 [Opitutus sp.]|nr:hypothetical protein [Opitutus sp.]
MLTVNKATLTITANDASRSYGASNPTFSYTASGFVNGETTAVLTGAPSLTTTASASSPAGAYAIAAAGGTLTAANYQFVFVNGTLTVNKATLTVTADNKNRTYGAVNPALTYAITGYVNGEGSAVLSGTPSLTTPAAATSTVGTYAITAAIGTLAASNYQFTFVNGTLTVTKATLTITANNASRTYGAANPGFSFTTAGFVNGETAAVLTGAPSLTTTADVSSPAGSYAINATIGTLAATNYQFTFVNGTLTVTKATLTITANDASRSYGASNPTFGYTAIGFVNSETIAVLTGAPSLTTPASASSPAGMYAITAAAGTLAAANYQFTFVNGTLTVGKATLTVTAENKARAYGAVNPAFTYTVSGYVNGETATVLGGSPGLSTSADTTSAVGTYAITAAAGTLAATNYQFTFVNGTLTVNKATLTITAEDKNRAYGAANPAFTYVVTGYANGESSAVLTGAPALTTTAGVSSVVGSYAITPATGTLSATNYQFAFVNGTLTVNKATLTVTADNKSWTYGAANPGFSYTTTGFLNGDTSSVLSGAPSLATTATTESPVGTYPITAGTGTLAAANYQFAFVDGTLTISKATLTITANNALRNYGTANPSFSYTPSGFLNGDSAAVLSGVPVLSSSATPGASVGTYAITAAAGTLTADNYQFVFVDGTLTVNKATLTIAADNASRSYGTANPSFSFTATGFVNADTSAVLSGVPTITTSATSGSAVGSYPIVIASGSLAATNYQFVFVNATLAILPVNQQPLAVVAFGLQDFNTTQILSSSGGSGGGVVGYEIVAQSAAGAAILTGANLTVNTGTGWVDVRATKATDGNFNAAISPTVRVTFVRINQAPLSVSATPSTVVYGNTSALNSAGGSGAGSVVFSSSNGGSVMGATFTATSGAGTAVVTGTKAATADYNAVTGTASITLSPRPVTITLNGSKNYDGSTVASGAQASVTSGTLAGGDSVSFVFAPTASTEVGDYTNLATATFRNASGTDVTLDYAVTATGSFTINPAPVIATGLRAWYRADRGIIKDADNYVSVWQDISGNEFHLQQQNAAKKPIWSGNGLGERPVVDFGSANRLQGATIDLLAGSSDMTVVVVLQSAQMQVENANLLEFDAAGQHGFSVAQAGSATNRYALSWRDSGGVLQGQASPISHIAALNPQTLVFVKSGNSQSAFVNGALEGTSSVAALMSGPLAQFGLGAYGGSNGVTASVAEVLIYNRALSVAERTQIEGAAVSRYGMYDSDNDGLLDSWEIYNIGSLALTQFSQLPGQTQTVGEQFKGGQNPGDIDSDGDGLSDRNERELNTNPNNRDSDADGLPDVIEANLGSDPVVANVNTEIFYVPIRLPLPAGASGAEATDVSSSGFVSGYTYGTATDQLVRWRLDDLTFQTTASPGDLYAHAINDSGVIVGSYNTWYPLRWMPGETPGPLLGNITGFANAINTSGEIAGESYGATTGAFRYSRNVQYLSAPSGYRWPEAYGISNDGVVVGRVNHTSSGEWAGIIWEQSGAVTTLSDFVPAAISNDGVLLGSTSSGPAVKVGGNSPVQLSMGGLNGFVYPFRISASHEALGQISSVPVIWRQDASGTWQFINLRTKILDLDVAQSFQGYSVNDAGLIAGSFRSDGNNRPVILKPSLLPMLAVDSNRDGVVDINGDTTSAAMAYRFWINDDDDVDDDDPDDSENAPVSSADYTDEKSDGIRDLEDFSRLKIYIGGLQDAVLQGHIQVGLKWKDTTGSPSLKVWRNLSPNGGSEYLTDVTVARQHMPLRGPGLVQGTTSYIIPTQYWQDVGLSSSQPYGNLLFEGCTVGTGQLVITLHKADGTVIGEGPGVWIDLRNIKAMYERVKATADGAENFPFPYNHVGSDPVPTPAMGWTPDPNGFPFEPAPGESATYIVSVHGWNQTYERSTMYAETMFKRMWHLGYKGRFAAFRWPTFYHQGLELPTSYNDSEYRALKCGVSLKQYLDTIPSAYTVNLVAHSMGNVVVGSALEKGASVANYALLNAAVPAICYDTSGNVVQTSWGYVTPNDDPDSATVALSYQGRLANVSGNLVNFFLPADSALSAWELNNDSPSGGRFPLLGAKPHQWAEGSLETAGYRYQRTASAGQKLRVVRVAGERILASPDEAMGFAVQAPSLTVGADGRTRGAIDDWVDMTAYGFDSVHSAEFLFTIHQTRDFYGTLLLKLGIAVQL